MKRTALKRRSSKPRKWQNWTLNRAYADGHKFDSIARYFPAYAPGLVGVPFGGLIMPVLPYEESATECHHILGGILGTSRWDIDANLIHLCRTTHLWAEKYSHDGLALALIAKKSMGEFEPDELNRIFHHDVVQWLSVQRFEFSWVRELFGEEFAI